MKPDFITREPWPVYFNENRDIRRRVKFKIPTENKGLCHVDFDETVNMDARDLIDDAVNVADEDAYRALERRCDGCL